jgi:hypothetical protein
VNAAYRFRFRRNASVSIELLLQRHDNSVEVQLCRNVAIGRNEKNKLFSLFGHAPENRRAEVVSSYLICCFAGNALPVIGIGVISTLAGPNVASLAFAATIAAFALVALFFGARYLPK